VRETAIELVIETRGHDHAREVVAAMNDSGYQTSVLH
jgi:threonine dehydratase